MMAWLSAHAALIAQILAVVVAVDTALASTDLVNASSTAHAIVNGIKVVAGWVQALLGMNKPPQA